MPLASAYTHAAIKKNKKERKRNSGQQQLQLWPTATKCMAMETRDKQQKRGVVAGGEPGEWAAHIQTRARMCVCVCNAGRS